MITVSGLTKQYGRRLAVDDMTFDVAAGRVTATCGTPPGPWARSSTPAAFAPAARPAITGGPPPRSVASRPAGAGGPGRGRPRPGRRQSHVPLKGLPTMPMMKKRN
jgi:hypothetical protein